MRLLDLRECQKRKNHDIPIHGHPPFGMALVAIKFLATFFWIKEMEVVKAKGEFSYLFSI